VLGVLALLTGWVLLTPGVLVVWVLLGGGVSAWMVPFLGIAASAPMLGFCTIGGLAAIAWGIVQLARGERDF
jgi:hypothetical protein